MANKNFHTKQLGRINQDKFYQAIKRVYDEGTTKYAPLGTSGNTELLYGIEGGPGACNRTSHVSVRRYNSTVELLITDTNGTFLFLGRYDWSLGLDFLANQYYDIFLKVKSKIRTKTPKNKIPF